MASAPEEKYLIMQIQTDSAKTEQNLILERFNPGKIQFCHAGCQSPLKPGAFRMFPN